MIVPGKDAVLHRLASTYRSGRLVPFVGSGMSRKTCTDWAGFIGGLESRAGHPTQPAEGTEKPDLVRRAYDAVRWLKGGERDDLAVGVRRALLGEPGGLPVMPPQMLVLARLWWPLVLTTNYDNCFAEAFTLLQPAQRLLAVVGRGDEDCQRVLNSLATAGRSLVWALQGYLKDVPFHHPPIDDATRARVTVSEGLETQLVVGHEEYRRVTYCEPHFRRAFAEVFRQRSLLFLGAGLKETYLQELFGEVLEVFGPATRPHYAFMPRDEVDQSFESFMLSRFQVVVLRYKAHEDVCDWLGSLADEVASLDRAPTVWGWGRVASAVASRGDEPDLKVVHGRLPEQPEAGACLAVCALSAKDEAPVLAGWGVDATTPPKPTDSQYLGAYEGQSVFAVGTGSDSLTHVYEASLALFNQVAPSFDRIHMQLLAIGGRGKNPPQAGRFPERFSFVQTVRAWAAWRRDHPEQMCTLTLYVDADDVLVSLDIASGRIDVAELLSCDDMRFFVEIVGDDRRLERRLYQLPAGTCLHDLVDHLQLSPAAWEMSVTPPPRIKAPEFRALVDADGRTLPDKLLDLGIVPGSTMHLRRPQPVKSSPPA